MKRIIVVLAFLLMVGACHAQTGENVKMTVELGEERDHVTIETSDPPDLAELKNIVSEPAVKSIYQEKLSAVFGEVSGLKIYIEEKDFIIEFDTNLAEEKDGKMVIERVDFDGVISEVSTLKIKLPEGYEMASGETWAGQVKDGYFEWNDIDYIPSVSYDRSFSTRQAMIWFFLIIVIVFLFGVMRNR